MVYVTSFKMRIERHTANKTTLEVSEEMRFNLPSSAKLGSLRVTLLKSGAYSVLCTPAVMSKKTKSHTGLTPAEQVHP